MCGRFADYLEIDALGTEWDLHDLTGVDFHARYNIAPTMPIRIVLESLDENTAEVSRELRLARWGLLPPFAKDLAFSSRTVNARSESLSEKPSFRTSLSSRRAIIPMSGYYEWKTGPGGKIPVYISSSGGPLLAAGLYSWWRPPGEDTAEKILTATVITQPSRGALADIHDRMPIMLTADAAREWLDPDRFERGIEAQGWVREERNHLEPEALNSYEVAPDVGSVRIQGPHLVEPASSTRLFSLD